jgi:Lon protease-like protein
MTLPLHIFEERYKIMIGECIDENREFGIVYFNGKEISKVGCTAQIREVIKQYESGEMDIVTVGRSRFYTREILDVKPYLEGVVTFFDDPPETVTDELTALARQGIESLKQLDRMTGGPETQEPIVEVDIKRVSFLISGIEGYTMEEKQRLLEMTSTKKRLESGMKSLQKVLQRVQLTHEIQNIISGNGNILKMLSKDQADE